MADYILEFDLAAFGELDRFALLGRQDYNLGNATDWFGSFRGGLYGFYARIHGIELHYHVVHSWIPRPRMPVENEYHVASVLFNMDSALECLTYALNALGAAALPDAFHDVTARKDLAKISPRDILGSPEATPPKEPLPGYGELFPSMQRHWLANRSFLQAIVELHDVSKHRQTICVGGMARRDPPLGFYEALGIAGDRSKEALFWPSSEIILRPDPKAPYAERTPAVRGECHTLEGLADAFVQFVAQTGRFALSDAKATIALAHTEFPPHRESAT